MAGLSPIPQPPTIPFLGNMSLIDSEVPLHSFELLAHQYGEIYKLVFSSGKAVVHVNSHALVRQISNDKRFQKTVSPTLAEVRNLAGDGLFTAFNHETNWAVARAWLYLTTSSRSF